MRYRDAEYSDLNALAGVIASERRRDLDTICGSVSEEIVVCLVAEANTPSPYQTMAAAWTRIDEEQRRIVQRWNPARAAWCEDAVISQARIDAEERSRPNQSVDSAQLNPSPPHTGRRLPLRQHRQVLGYDQVVGRARCSRSTNVACEDRAEYRRATRCLSGGSMEDPMLLHQFVHLNGYGIHISQNRKKECLSVDQVFEEMLRRPGSHPHVARPKPARTVYGDPIGTWARIRREQRIQTMPDGRSLRKDSIVCLVGVASYPVHRSEILTSGKAAYVDALLLWVQANLNWLEHFWGPRAVQRYRMG